MGSNFISRLRPNGSIFQPASEDGDDEASECPPIAQGNGFVASVSQRTLRTELRISIFRISFDSDYDDGVYSN